MNILPALAAGVTWALLASVHCASMCGPFMVLTGSPARWQAGRLLGYSALGATSGALGHAVMVSGPWPSLRFVPTVLAAVGVLSGAAALAAIPLPWRPRFSSPVVPLVARAKRSGADVLLGAAVAVLPCGISWGAFGIAAATGEWSSGLAVAVGLWLGSLLPLLAVRVFGATLRGASMRTRRVLAFGALCAGLWAVGSRGLATGPGTEHCHVDVQVNNP